MTKHSSLYTRTGDAGATSILKKVRLSKADQRFEAIGTLDELNAQLGVVVATIREASDDSPFTVRDSFELIQSDLLGIGSYLANPTLPEASPISDERITELENMIDELDAQAPKLESFILPGGSTISAQLHVARAVCRRAERCLVRLGDKLCIAPLVFQYLNRLSDALFAAARAANHATGAPETIWVGKHTKAVIASSESSGRGDLETRRLSRQWRDPAEAVTTASTHPRPRNDKRSNR